MSKYSVTTGILNTPVKVVLYGPEGIGKSKKEAEQMAAKKALENMGC